MITIETTRDMVMVNHPRESGLACFLPCGCCECPYERYDECVEEMNERIRREGLTIVIKPEEEADGTD